MPSFKRVIKLPEYSALSKASTLPPLLSKPFQRTQKSLDCLIGESSASNAPALVNNPFASRISKESKYLSSKLLPVQTLYLSLNFEKAKSLNL